MSETSVEIADNLTLCETLDRVLNKGAVIVGNLTISVAGVDLIYADLRLMLSSSNKLQNESECAESSGES